MDKKYKVVMNDIKSKISKNIYKSGEALPIELDLAKHYGFSRVTIQKAMKELVKEGLIYRIAGKGTFIGNHTSAQAAVNHSSIFCVVIASDKDSEMFRLISGIEEEFANNNDLYSLHFMNKTPNDSDFMPSCSYDSVLLRVAGLNPKGILCYPPNSDDGYLGYLEIQKKGIPLILLDKEFSRYPVNCVVSDNYSGMHRLTKYVIENGHQKIGYLSFDMSFGDTLVKRKQGFLDCLLDHHIQANPNAISDNSKNFIDIQDNVKRLLENNPGLTALICANDSIAEHCYPIITSLGYSIPDDISIGSFDGFERGNSFAPPLTSVHQDLYELGKHAAKTMIDLSQSVYNGHEIHYIFKHTIPTHLIVRQSVKRNV